MADRLYDIKEIAKRTKESLLKRFPNLTFSVTFDRSGSNSMQVRLMKGDFNPFTKPDIKNAGLNNYYIDRDDRLTEEAKKILIEVREIAQIYNWDNSDPMTDYFDVNYYLNMSIGKPEKPYEIVTSKKASTSYPRSASSKSYPAGDVLNDCSGWTIYKKTLPDGRIVYNAKIKADTPKNRGDWTAIKGEIYTDTGFKWGKFGAFEKWGQIASEEFVIKKLCEILGKYYQAGTTTKPTPAPTPAPTTTPIPEPKPTVSIIAEGAMRLESEIWDNLGIKSGGQLLQDESLQEKYAAEIKGTMMPYLDFFGLLEAQKLTLAVILADQNYNRLNNALTLIGYYGEEDKKQSIEDYSSAPNSFLNPKYYGYNKEEFEIYINGELVHKTLNKQKASVWLNNRLGNARYLDMQSAGQVYFVNDDKVYVFNNSFIYGSKWGVSKEAGNDLQYRLAEKGYVVVGMGTKKRIVVSKGNDGLNIDDGGGVFDIDSNRGFITAISYLKNGSPISTTELADAISQVFETEYSKSQQPQIAQTQSKEDIQKAINGLQYLADKGNEDAKKAIKGLQYLLNK